MLTSLISIGNSRAFRIPKPLLSESGFKNKVELKVKKGEIRIVAVPTKSKSMISTAALSEKALGVDWNRPEEDKAWVNLQ